MQALYKHVTYVSVQIKNSCLHMRPLHSDI